jgi:hypothetical protein
LPAPASATCAAAGKFADHRNYLGPCISATPPYGNTGSRERLDFTVAALRSSGWERSRRRPVRAQCADFDRRDGDERSERRNWPGSGRACARGIEQPQELFTVIPPRPPEARLSQLQYD